MQKIIPKFIPLYPSLLQHYGIVEASILGYLDFFQSNNKDFNCTNEDLAELLNVSESTIKRSLSTLKKNGEIEITKKIKEGGGILRNISISENGLMQRGNLAQIGGSKGPLHNINQKELKKEKEIKEKESEKIPSVSQLVEAYKNHPELVKKIGSEGVVRQWAEYKQRRKSKAYKTVEGFIQQLVENVTTVSYGEIQYDVGDRLRYAQNKAIDGDNYGIWRDDRMERGYQNLKKIHSLTQRQNE